MLTAEQFHSTLDFSEYLNRFINRDGVLLLRDDYRDSDFIKNAFFVYGKDKNKHFLGEISFQTDSNHSEHFIDHDVILNLIEKGWI